ncbi:MAG: GrpB family protein [Candidatus Binataceae bacterium]
MILRAVLEAAGYSFGEASEDAECLSLAEPVIIVPYDPRWPRDFVLIQSMLRDALGEVDILHVGSTSVPGLAAKAIVDIDVVIDSEDALPLTIQRLATIDYRFEGDLGVSGRYAFAPPRGLPRHHPYVCVRDCLELQRHIAFRDFLREHPEETKDYADLKYDLARRFGGDQDGYSVAKTAFVENALRKAALLAGRNR